MTQDEMKELRDYFDAKFGAVDRRFDGVDKRLDSMDRRFDGVDQRFDRIEATMEHEFGGVTTQFVELRGYIEDVYERTNTRMDVQFDTLRAELKMGRRD